MTDAELPDGAQPPSGARPEETPSHDHSVNGNGQVRTVWGLPAPAAPAEGDEEPPRPDGLPRRRPGGTLTGLPTDLREPVPPDPEAAERVLAHLTEDQPSRGRHVRPVDPPS